MRILISGAGVAGPALAWHAAKTGAAVTILDKSESLLRSGHNIDVNGSALTVIKKMGLFDELRRLTTTEKGTQVLNDKGGVFASFPVRAGHSASATSENEILRGDLAWMLYTASKARAGVDYRFGVTVEEVISNGDEAVTVRLSSGETRDYDLLVAADGQWSKIRKQCFPSEAVTVVDKDMYVAYSTIPRLESDNDWWNVYFALGSRIITTRPDPYNTIRAMFTRMPWNAAQKEAWQKASRGDRKTQLELLRREFADAGWQSRRLLDAMDEAEDFYFQAVQQIRMSTWSTGRVVCLGDTAYAPTPLTGMGSSLAILGGYVLGGELSKLDDGEHPRRALQAYESAFRPFVEKIQDIPSFVPAVAHPDVAWKRWMIWSFLWTFSKVATIPWLLRWFDHDESAADFPLPQYARFEKEASEEW
ncbi:hypothetical protein LTR53_004637 [Teratosphaeriaceae sp. CCFEE 6253]|nr:hypothetical protein LTR53_004637 [Teratosphaeriaceae sp. CCFEE 6253]